MRVPLKAGMSVAVDGVVERWSGGGGAAQLSSAVDARGLSWSGGRSLSSGEFTVHFVQSAFREAYGMSEVGGK
jgi:hypothetical protein